MQPDNHELETIKARLANLPRRAAPPQLILKLREITNEKSWFEKTWLWFVQPWVWRSMSATVAAAGIFMVWSLYHPAQPEFVDMDTLLTAHSRYQEESLIPTADMAQSDYSARLASFYDEE